MPPSVAFAPLGQTGEAPRAAWQRRLRATLVVADAVAVLAATAVAWAARGGQTRPGLQLFTATFSYTALGLFIVPLWFVCLAISDAYDSTVVGTSTTEYSRVARAVVMVFVVVCALAFLGHTQISRSLIAVFFPALGILAVGSRWVVRKHLHHRRARGKDLRKIVIVGHQPAAAKLINHLHRSPHAGYRVVGSYVPDADRETTVADVPVFGAPDQLLADLTGLSVDAVVITDNDLFRHASLRSLAWLLHGTEVTLLMAPKLTEIAGPRIVCQPAAGLPLLLVEEPNIGGAAQVVKAAIERLAAAVALVALSPLLVVVALAVKLTSPGPVLYRQTRIGRRGRPFTMWKFRTMVDGAHRRRGDVVPDEHLGGVLFKARKDPRVTVPGRFLRRHSLDELPQLWNVVRGEMAIVGPRPPLPEEVARYRGESTRRLMVKPGLTGLWQVSGRSDLSWAESVQLDLHYVENWSLLMDLAILAKTVKVVVTGEGAY